MRIVISAGHGLLIRGASGIIDEVEEARKVVPAVADWLRKVGHNVLEFYDDTSQTQSENLDTIINFHNAQDRDVDVSVHFNAYEQTDEPVGTEVLYLTQEGLASRVSAAIAKAGGLINRGAKYKTNLAFLNGTDEPSILLEICFVDSEADVEAYQNNFEAICKAIAMVGLQTDVAEGVSFSGKCSWFGGPDDMGVSEDEGLAFIYNYDQAPHLFLDQQPPGTTGLARRLDPAMYYVACRWDYAVTPKTMLDDADKMALVKAPKTGRRVLAWPADWGPHDDTDRVADLSPGLLDALGIKTDDEVLVQYPIQIPAVLLR
jgi:N-acetylmuramoyl-L-alanine amidase